MGREGVGLHEIWVSERLNKRMWVEEKTLDFKSGHTFRKSAYLLGSN